MTRVQFARPGSCLLLVLAGAVACQKKPAPSAQEGTQLAAAQKASALTGSRPERPLAQEPRPHSVEWERGGAGWTEVQASEDSRIVYVSSSRGDDGNSGHSPEAPVRTIRRGVGLMRDGFPDQLLLRRGDVWDDESLGAFLSGRSSTEPIVVAAYGDAEVRPRLNVKRPFLDHDGVQRSYFRLIGLSIVNYARNPDDPRYDGKSDAPLRLVGGGTGILIEDCRLQYAGIILQSFKGGRYRDVTIRRNIILDYFAENTSTSKDERPSGIYADAFERLTIEDNVFDHNGWSEVVPGAGANMFNHNVYLQYGSHPKDLSFRNNIVARASAHGVHGRSGGSFEENLFVQNSIGLQIGYKDHPLPAGSETVAVRNVILDGKLMDPKDANFPRTAAVWGLMLADLGAGNVLLKENLVAHRRDDGSNVGIAEDAGARYVGNVQFEWGGGIGDMTDSHWKDPNRTVASYHALLGGPASLESFLHVLRNRPARSWDERYTARAVNAYIREGFEKGSVSTAP